MRGGAEIKMKKILFGIFAIVLFTTSAYCDNEQKTIDPNGSYQSILQSQVRVDAIRAIIEHHGAAVLMADMYLFSPSDFVYELRKNATNGITVAALQDACENAKPIAYTCMDLIDQIIWEHNKLVLEDETETGLLDEQRFNKISRSIKKCSEAIFLNGNYRLNEPNCRRTCREYAAEHICKIENLLYSIPEDSDMCWCNPSDGGNGQYKYIPTYEDYKKAKRGTWF